MELAGQLEIAAHSLTAVLGLWLGLTVATRSSTTATVVFTVLALALAAWSSSIIVQRLPTLEEARTVAHAIEELAAAVALGATAHFALMIASEGLPTPRQLAIVSVAYVVNIAFAIPGIVDPAAPVALGEPNLSIGPVPGVVLGLAWVVVRLLTLGIGIWWVLVATRRAAPDSLRRRQLRAALVTLLAGGFGASLRFLPGIGDADAWIGVSFVTLAIVVATYAVLSAGLFFGSAVAGRAFVTSVVGGLVVVALIVVLVVVERATQTFTGIDLPLFSALVLVVVVAMYEPVVARLRDRSIRGDGPSGARRSVLRAISPTGRIARPAAAGVGPALDRLASALSVDGLAVIRPDGQVIASHGNGAREASIEPIPLTHGDAVLGELRVGRTTDGAALTAHDEELLRLSAAYVAAALRAGRTEDAQVASLTALAQERATVEAQAEVLHEALVQHDSQAPPLDVHVLGPMRVERAGDPITRWGGDKAGSRQAQAIFGFLLDRGDRGVDKDEVLELIWPDVDLERADLAFHRTLVGLRRTLDPRGGGGRASGSIRFQNDRYRLDSTVIGWSDVRAFEAALDRASDASDPADRIAALEEARGLYRGPYLDDCPYFGDSADVEIRRDQLRTRCIDALAELASTYAASGDRLRSQEAERDAQRLGR